MNSTNLSNASSKLRRRGSSDDQSQLPKLKHFINHFPRRKSHSDVTYISDDEWTQEPHIIVHKQNDRTPLFSNTVNMRFKTSKYRKMSHVTPLLLLCKIKFCRTALILQLQSNFGIPTVPVSFRNGSWGTRKGKRGRFQWFFHAPQFVLHISQ